MNHHLTFPPRPPARENNHRSPIHSPRRLLIAGPRREDTYPTKPKISPRTRLKPVPASTPSNLSPRRLTGGLDGDARNMHFLTEMLSVIGGLDQINEDLIVPHSSPSHSLQAPRRSLPLNTSTKHTPHHTTSPRTGKVYSREDTLALQRALGHLVQRSRAAVVTMNNALHRQATNLQQQDRHSKNIQAKKRIKHRVPGPNHSRKRLMTVGGVPTNTSAFPVSRANTRFDTIKNQRERPGSAASMSILDTALSVAQEAKAWDIVTCEVVRQVHNDCKERGVLLNFIRLRNKQTTELLVALCKTQQQMLENFAKRHDHMRPRTKTVDRMYKKKKREQEVNEFTEAFKKHQRKLEQARVRIQRLSNQLVHDTTKGARTMGRSKTGEGKTGEGNTGGGNTGGGNTGGDSFEETMEDQREQKQFETSKLAFQSLISDLSRIERESARFKNMVTSITDDGTAAREALEQHRSYVQAKISEQETLENTTLLVQAHWRGYRARKGPVVAAKLAYAQRKLQQETLRQQQLKEKAKLKVARWSYRQYQIWDMKCRMDGLLQQDRERRMELARKHKYHHHHVSKKHSWSDYLNGCLMIQKAYRHRLWVNTTWRRRWLRRVKKQHQNELLDSITDEKQRELIKRTIAVSLQEQEQQFITRLHTLKDQVEQLTRKNKQSDKLAKEHFTNAETKVEQMKQMYEKKTKQNKEECDNKLREKQIILHQLSHALEATKVQHIRNARTKVDKSHEETTAEYALNALRKSVNDMVAVNEKQSASQKYFFHLDRQADRSAVKSRQGEILTDPSGQGNDVHMKPNKGQPEGSSNAPISMSDAFKIAQVQRELTHYRRLMLKTMKDIQARATSVEDVFLEQDNERKVLVIRNVELERELHSFDPGHQGVIHHNTNHRSHHLNKIRNERDEKNGQQHHHKHRKHHHHKQSRRHSTTGATKHPHKEHRVQHPMVLPVKDDGSLDLDAHTALSRRRPSVLRPHYTVGLF